MENMFMDIIYKKMMPVKIYPRFKNWLYYKRFLIGLNKVSPDFEMLWHFADFIKLLEITSWYDNSKHNSVFSSKDYSKGENGFIINRENPKMQIVLKLYSKNESISLSIKRDYGHKKNSEISFINQQLELETQEDEILMLKVIKIITDTMGILLKEYYEKA